MRKSFFLLLITFTGISLQLSAQGDLLVTPKRVVFEGNKQKEELNLLNLGSDTATFSISFVQRNMNEDGSFMNVEHPDSLAMLAEPYLRVFPRKVTLAPGEPQVVSLQCKRRPDMKAGEYRSHLYFRSEKDYTALGSKNKPVDSTNLSVQLIPIFGISIPVIIRSGEVKVAASFSDLKLEIQNDTIPVLKLTVNRTGNISVYGNFKVDYVPLQGKPYTVGVINGVGIYTNINKRFISIRLKNEVGTAFTSGKLRVRYTSPEDAKYVVYAEAELDLANQK